jgi:hypothetical protein
MPLHPRVGADLLMAPVAVAIDLNLQEFRDLEPAKIREYLELELDRPELDASPTERAARVLEAASRNANLHGWTAEVTPDNDRLRISGGSVTLDIGLSASILGFISGET